MRQRSRHQNRQRSLGPRIRLKNHPTVRMIDRDSPAARSVPRRKQAPLDLVDVVDTRLARSGPQPPEPALVSRTFVLLLSFNFAGVQRPSDHADELGISPKARARVSGIGTSLLLWGDRG